MYQRVIFHVYFYLRLSFDKFYSFFQGMGPNMKSSAQPTQVKTLNDVDVVSLAAGVSHTVYVAQTKNEAEKEKLYNKFEEFDQTAMDAKA